MRARLELVDDLLDGDDRALRGEHRLLLHSGQAPEHDVAAPSACWAWMTATSGLSARTALTRSPVNGLSTGATESFSAARSVPS